MLYPTRISSVLGLVVGLVLSGGIFVTDLPASTTDPGTWSQLLPPPTRRAGAAVVCDPVQNRLILFGGGNAYNEELVADVWTLPLSGGAWTRLFTVGTPPEPRSGHSMIYDPAGGRLLIYGGATGTTPFGEPVGTGELWELDLNSTPAWSQLAPAGPTPDGRFDHAAVYDSDRHAMVIFGGETEGDQPLDDAWTLPLSGTLAWSEIITAGPKPQARKDAAAVYDPSIQAMRLHGGIVVGSTRNDTWDLFLQPGNENWTERFPSNPPTKRWGHAAVLDPAVPGRMLMFGGQLGTSPITYSSEVWALHLNAWTLLTTTGAPPDHPHRSAVALDAVGRRLFVSGGARSSTLENSVLEFAIQTETWSSVTATPVPPLPERTSSLSVYDPVRHRLLVFGGQHYDSGSYTSTNLNDL